MIYLGLDSSFAVRARQLGSGLEKGQRGGCEVIVRLGY